MPKFYIGIKEARIDIPPFTVFSTNITIVAINPPFCDRLAFQNTKSEAKRNVLLRRNKSILKDFVSDISVWIA